MLLPLCRPRRHASEEQQQQQQEQEEQEVSEVRVVLKDCSSSSRGGRLLLRAQPLAQVTAARAGGGRGLCVVLL